jgi:hypothetical protein
MLARLRTRLSFANVVSVIALFVALGGTSIAAVTLARNSVKGKHIAANAVSSSEVKDASLLAGDFGPGQLPKGEKGDPGTAGVPGTPGTPGSPAASWVTGNLSAAIPAHAAASGANASNFSPSGQTELSGSDLGRAQVSPNAPIVVRDLFVRQENATGAGELRYQLRDLTNPPFPNVLLQCSTTGVQTTCNSGSQSATVPAGSRLVIRLTLSGDTVSTFAGWGFRATTP